MRKPLKTRATVTEAEWNRLEEIFSATLYIDVIKKLRAADNAPQRACDLFVGLRLESGLERMDHISQREGSDLVLARMKAWTVDENRPERLLAFARDENRTAS